MKVTTPDGRETTMEPTRSDSHRRQAAEERKQVEKRAAKAEAAAVKRRREGERRRISDMQNREMALDGLKRFAKKEKRNGNESRAATLQALANEAGEVLRDYTSATIKTTKRQADPLAVAGAKAAKSLVKALPGCFDSTDDAQEWALRNLPLTVARAATNAQENVIRKTARERRDLGHRFWGILERAGAKSGLGVDAVHQFKQLGAL